MLILAGVSLNATIGENGIITNAMYAKIMSEFANYKEELGINCVDDQEVYATKEKMKQYIPSLEDKYIDSFVLVKSKLLYVGTDEIELDVANRLGIGSSSDSSDAGATVKEVQAIVDGVVEVSEENKAKIPTDDLDKTDVEEYTDDSKGLIGTRLFDRSGLNMTNNNWNILIEYNNENKETARYGSGYYWLKKGQIYIINGETIEFKNDYVVNYKEGEFTVLSGRAVNWNVNATLGVTENIALNLDPMSLANGEWKSSEDENYEDFWVNNFKTEIQKKGDVSYDASIKGLKFNQTTTDGYIRLKKDNVDCSGGFTYELFAKISKTDRNYSGFFCRRLETGWNYRKSMRFFYCFNTEYEQNEKVNFVARFGPSNNIETEKSFSENRTIVACGYDGGDQQGCIKIKPEVSGIEVGKEFYLTGVYVVTGSPLADDYMKINNFDRFEWYINGKLIDYCYLTHEGFEEGLSMWNQPGTYFYIGQNMRAETLYYLIGDVYSTRLYTKSLTPDQVKLNYDMTLKYRDSFKNE